MKEIHHWIRYCFKFANRPTSWISLEIQEGHPNDLGGRSFMFAKTIDELQEAIRFAQPEITAFETVIDTTEKGTFIQIKCSTPNSKQCKEPFPDFYMKELFGMFGAKW